MHSIQYNRLKKVNACMHINRSPFPYLKIFSDFVHWLAIFVCLFICIIFVFLVAFRKRNYSPHLSFPYLFNNINNFVLVFIFDREATWRISNKIQIVYRKIIVHSVWLLLRCVCSCLIFIYMIFFLF